MEKESQTPSPTNGGPRKILSRRSLTRYLLGAVPLLIGIPALIAVASLAVDRWLGTREIVDLAWLWPVGLVTLLLGLGLWLWSPTLLVLRGKGIPLEDTEGPVFDGGTKKLVCTGPYRHTRNPMYTGYITSMVSVGVLLNSPTMVVVATILGCVWTYVFVVRYEEKALLHRFGDEYQQYCANVPRFFPRLTPYRALDPPPHARS